MTVPNKIQAALNKAEQAFAAERFSEAKIILKKTIDTSEGRKWQDLFVLYHTLGFYHYVSEQYQEAEQIFLQSIAVCKIESECGVAYHALGCVYKDQDRFEEAILQFTKAVNSNFSGLVSFDSSSQIADIFSESYDYTNEIKYRKKALAFAEEYELTDDYLDCARRLGEAYRLSEEHSKVVAVLEKGLYKAREANKADWEKLFIGNLSTAYLDSGQRKKGEEFALRLLEISEHTDLIDDKTTAYNNLALINKERGDYAKAIEWMQKAIEIEENPHSQEIQLRNMSSFYEDVGDLSTALFYSLEAHNYAQKSEDKISLVKAGMQVANLYFDKDNYYEAIRYLEDCLKIVDSQNLSAFTIDILTQLGSCHSRLDNFNQALQFQQKALDVARKTQAGKLEFSIIHESIGNSYLREEQFEEAEKHYLLSREYYPDESDLITLSNLGAMYHVTGRYEQAGAIFEQAIVNFEEQRKTLSNFDRKRFDEKYAGIFEYAAATEARQGNFTTALRYIEKLKGRELNADYGEALTENDYVSQLPQPEEDEVILYFVNSHHKRPLVFCLTSEGIKGQFLSPKILLDGIESFQKSIGQKYGPDTQYSFTKNQSAFELIPHPGNFDAVILYYNERLTQHHSFWHIKKQRTTDLSKALYQYMIAPFEACLKSKNKLIIVPDRALHLMPFETLIDYKGKYLIEKATVSYVFNLSQYELLKRRRYTFKKDCLTIGVEKYAPLLLDTKDETSYDSLPALEIRVKTAISNKENTDNFYAYLGIKKWVNLNYVKKELNYIHSIFNKSENLAERLATPSKIEELSQENKLTHYKSIHFATHGISVPLIPELSSLVLNKGVSRNRYLRSTRIKKLRINADLVCLSACDTGSGELLASIGLVGLPHAFLSAGAKSVLVSLWSINDQYTSEFIREFYRIYSQGNTCACALAEVKQRCIAGKLGEQLRNPLYWAAFTLIGAGQ